MGLVVLSDDEDDDGQVANGGDQNGGGEASPTPTFVSQLPETDETVNPEETAPPEVEPVSPPPGVSPALPLSSESECQVRTSAVVLTWQTGSPGGEQVVDLVSNFDDFAPGSYETSQVLSSDVDSLTWKGLTPGVRYFWRINTQIDSKWVTSQSSQFVAAGCEQIDEA